MLRAGRDGLLLQQSIGHNVEILRGRIEKACRRSNRDVSEVKLIAVGKNFDSHVIRTALDCGLRDFGENRVQEVIPKYAELADVRKKITLHYIGHLQSNKVRDALQVVDIIHSIDTIRLASLVSEKAGRPVPVLLQVNLAGEQTKYGFTREDLTRAVDLISVLPNIEIRGLMTIAPIFSDPEEARQVFAGLKSLNSVYGFKELSMGMTDDFEAAVEEGATMIRIGRAIFGARS
jgi:pyridoxal phosphate enzyme (YggS family)